MFLRPKTEFGRTIVTFATGPTLADASAFGVLAPLKIPDLVDAIRRSIGAETWRISRRLISICRVR